MNNAFGEPQTILLLGGTSDIGVAIASRLISPATTTVVLAARDVVAAETVATRIRDDHRLPRAATVAVVAFEAAETTSHQRIVDEIAQTHGDIDVAIVAFGVLGSQDSSRDTSQAAAVAGVNFAGAVSTTIAVGQRMRAQGRGQIVVLSSVAGERVRAANPVYGATKAGIDAFAQGYGDLVAGDGVHVLVVRPGFVHSTMTEGMKPAPFSTTPDHVAEVAVQGLRNRRRMVWAPAPLRYVFGVLRHLPGPIWRRLPLG